MRHLALVTGGMLAALALFALLLPGSDRYVPGVDDGPPQRFSSIADAERAAGFDFPDAGVPPGWTLQTVIVTPAYYGRRLLAERPDLLERRQPLRDAVASGRATEGLVYFWLTDGLPDPPPGVSSYVNVVYNAENGAFVSLNVPQIGLEQGPFPPISGVTNKTTRSIHLGSGPATLTTYKSQSSDAMVADWRVGRMPIRATAFNGSNNPKYRITQDEFIAFLGKVH